MLSLLLRNACRDVKPAISLIQRRTLINFRMKVSEKTYRRKDKIDESFSIIYKAPMEYYLATCNYFTTISAVVFAALTAYKLSHFGEEVSTVQVELDYLHGNATMSDQENLYFAIALVGFCIAIRMIVYKYPLRIYRNQSK